MEDDITLEDLFNHVNAQFKKLEERETEIDKALETLDKAEKQLAYLLENVSMSDPKYSFYLEQKEEGEGYKRWCYKCKEHYRKCRINLEEKNAYYMIMLAENGHLS